MIAQASIDTSRDLLISNENGSQFIAKGYVTVGDLLRDPLLRAELADSGCVRIEIAPLRHGGDDLTPSDIPVVGRPNSDE